MQQEVTIHQSLSHRHIVQFFSYFEDQNNVYIVLELCRRRVRILTEHLSFRTLSLSLVTDGIASAAKDSH